MLSVVVEREIPYPPEKLWRALTQPHLIEESEECDDLYSHAYEHGDPFAHGAVGLPAGSEAGLPGRQIRLAEGGGAERALGRATSVLVALHGWSR